MMRGVLHHINVPRGGLIVGRDSGGVFTGNIGCRAHTNGMLMRVNVLDRGLGGTFSVRRSMFCTSIR